MAPPSARARLSVVIPLVYADDGNANYSATAVRGSVVGGTVQRMRVPYRVPSRCWHSRRIPSGVSRFRGRKRSPDLGAASFALDLQKPISPSRLAPRASNSNTPKKRSNDITECVGRRDDKQSVIKRDDSNIETQSSASSESDDQLENSRAITHVLERVSMVPSVLGITGLEVLLLRGNDIVDFSPLRSCERLLYLDLSYNRVRAMPSPTFFQGQPGPVNLRTLLLDHNFISEWDNLRQALEAAQWLTILTLANNPIANMIGYRCGVVNAAPALALLDQYPVADEELIEGACFAHSRFSAPARGRQACNTHWSSSEPPLSLDFVSIGRAIARLGGESALIAHANLITTVVRRLAASLSPSSVIQRLVKAWLKRNGKQRKRRLRLKVVATALNLVRLDRIRKRNSKRDAATIIQSFARRYNLRAVAERHLRAILIEHGESRSLVDYVDTSGFLSSKDAANLLAQFEAGYENIYFDVGCGNDGNPTKVNDSRRKGSENTCVILLKTATQTKRQTFYLTKHASASTKLCRWYRRAAGKLRRLEATLTTVGVGGKFGAGVLFSADETALPSSLKAVLRCHAPCGHSATNEECAKETCYTPRDSMDIAAPVSPSARFEMKLDEWIDKNAAYSWRVLSTNDDVKLKARLAPSFANAVKGTIAQFTISGGGEVCFYSRASDPHYSNGKRPAVSRGSPEAAKLAFDRALFSTMPKRALLKRRGCRPVREQIKPNIARNVGNVIWWHVARAPSAAELLRAVRHARARAMREGRPLPAILWHSLHGPASRIQATWRGMATRKSLSTHFYAAAIQKRACLAIARWWRAWGFNSMRRRHIQLVALKRAAMACKSPRLYMEPELFYLLTSTRSPWTGIRKATSNPHAPMTLEFGIDEDSCATLRSVPGMLRSRIPKDARERPPRWTLPFLPPYEPEHGRLVDIATLLTEGVRPSIEVHRVCTTRHYDDDEQFSAAQPRLILRKHGTACYVGATSAFSKWTDSGCEMVEQRFVALDFASDVEARSRLAAVLMLTWDQRRGNHAPLLSAEVHDLDNCTSFHGTLPSTWRSTERKITARDHLEIELLCQRLCPHVPLPFRGCDDCSAQMDVNCGDPEVCELDKSEVSVVPPGPFVRQKEGDRRSSNPRQDTVENARHRAAVAQFERIMHEKVRKIQMENALIDRRMRNLEIRNTVKHPRWKSIMSVVSSDKNIADRPERQPQPPSTPPPLKGQFLYRSRILKDDDCHALKAISLPEAGPRSPSSVCRPSDTGNARRLDIWPSGTIFCGVIPTVSPIDECEKDGTIDRSTAADAASWNDTSMALTEDRQSSDSIKEQSTIKLECASHAKDNESRDAEVTQLVYYAATHRAAELSGLWAQERLFQAAMLEQRKRRHVQLRKEVVDRGRREYATSRESVALARARHTQRARVTKSEHQEQKAHAKLSALEERKNQVAAVRASAVDARMTVVRRKSENALAHHLAQHVSLARRHAAQAAFSQLRKARATALASLCNAARVDRGTALARARENAEYENEKCKQNGVRTKTLLKARRLEARAVELANKQAVFLQRQRREKELVQRRKLELPSSAQHRRPSCESENDSSLPEHYRSALERATLKSPNDAPKLGAALDAMLPVLPALKPSPMPDSTANETQACFTSTSTTPSSCDGAESPSDPPSTTAPPPLDVF